jgi:hypothetical protein
MCVYIAAVEKIEGVEITEVGCVFISLRTNLSQLYVMAAYDGSSTGTVY